MSSPPPFAASYPHGHARPANQPPPPIPTGPMTCPECNRETESLKRFTYLSYLVFIGIFAFWSVKHNVACPSCMRKDLLLRLAMNTVLANLLWPFVILPWNGILFVLTFTSGHSRPR